MTAPGKKLFVCSLLTCNDDDNTIITVVSSSHKECFLYALLVVTLNTPCETWAQVLLSLLKLLKGISLYTCHPFFFLRRAGSGEEAPSCGVSTGALVSPPHCFDHSVCFYHHITLLKFILHKFCEKDTLKSSKYL